MNKAIGFDEWVLIVALALFCIILCCWPGRPAFAFGTAASVAVLVAGAICRPPDRQQLLFLATAMPISLLVIGVGNNLVVAFTPHLIDAALSSLDHGASIALFHWTLRHRACFRVLAIVYSGLPVAAALCLLDSPRRIECAWALALSSVGAPVFYLIFPAVGPAWVAVAGAPRNCLPSMHVTWALLLVIYAAPRWRGCAAGFAILTACSTIGLGEHYLIDLAAAVPYTIAVWLLVRRWLAQHTTTDLQETGRASDDQHRTAGDAASAHELGT